MWKTERKVQEPRDVFRHAYMKKGVRYISLTIQNSEFCLILCLFV